MNFTRKFWRRVRDIFPTTGFSFDRPIVVLQSDDWGRAGVCDQSGFDSLRAAGMSLGERAYDFYTLETAEDLAALQEVLGKHRDVQGRPACMMMNFILANLDFTRMQAEDFRQIHLFWLADGLPGKWNRPGLLDAYRNGIAAGVFRPALHGATHFCRFAVERNLSQANERAFQLQHLWQSNTSYIHWRMPWIGYEYWDPERPADERFLSFATQRELIGHAVGEFARLFSTLPHSACAPGYRANGDTLENWAQYGVHVAQNGPGTRNAPHLDRHGMLNLYRTVEFEPATDVEFSVDVCLLRASQCFARGVPAIVSLHSINFHSSVKNFRSRTIELLDEFLSRLQMAHPDLLYLGDEDLYALVSDTDGSVQKKMEINVTKRKFRKSRNQS